MNTIGVAMPSMVPSTAPQTTRHGIHGALGSGSVKHAFVRSARASLALYSFAASMACALVNIAAVAPPASAPMLPPILWKASKDVLDSAGLLVHSQRHGNGAVELSAGTARLIITGTVLG